MQETAGYTLPGLNQRKKVKTKRLFAQVVNFVERLNFPFRTAKHVVNAIRTALGSPADEPIPHSVPSRISGVARKPALTSHRAKRGRRGGLQY
jgi:hypothetical protein